MEALLYQLILLYADKTSVKHFLLHCYIIVKKPLQRIFHYKYELFHNFVDFLCHQGLAETKLELRRKEQTVRQVNKQLATLEGEKESLCNNLQDAEKALRTVAK